ncbi:hypothetical protein Y1Q_0014671 [Alligator mississippiensis]|uniref:Uncharacterized protein n=1 Tax=Alligator mississippiensis TaxID=8496 RepID=A0A151P7Z5_ALLMI|nr:hypothetical protein Y1Q_0014671 [Alligator mississippiensis]
MNIWNPDLVSSFASCFRFIRGQNNFAGIIFLWNLRISLPTITALAMLTVHVVSYPILTAWIWKDSSQRLVILLSWECNSAL